MNLLLRSKQRRNPSEEVLDSGYWVLGISPVAGKKTADLIEKETLVLEIACLEHHVILELGRIDNKFQCISKVYKIFTFLDKHQ